jgi:hypothetical protein
MRPERDGEFIIRPWLDKVASPSPIVGLFYLTWQRHKTSLFK